MTGLISEKSQGADRGFGLATSPTLCVLQLSSPLRDKVVLLAFFQVIASKFSLQRSKDFNAKYMLRSSAMAVASYVCP